MALVEIVQLEGLEVADQNVAGAVVLGQRVEITPGLLVGLGLRSRPALFCSTIRTPGQKRSM